MNEISWNGRRRKKGCCELGKIFKLIFWNFLKVFEILRNFLEHLVSRIFCTKVFRIFCKIKVYFYETNIFKFITPNTRVEPDDPTLLLTQADKLLNSIKEEYGVSLIHGGIHVVNFTRIFLKLMIGVPHHQFKILKVYTQRPGVNFTTGIPPWFNFTFLVKHHKKGIKLRQFCLISRTWFFSTKTPWYLSFIITRKSRRNPFYTPHRV